MARPSLFNFIPLKQTIVKSEPEVMMAMFYPKMGRIVLNQRHPDTQAWLGRWVKIVLDVQKKIVGWKFVDHTMQLEELGEIMQIKETPSNKTVGFGTTAITHALDLEGKKTFKKLRVLSTRSMNPRYDQSPTYYIQLSDKQDQEEDQDEVDN